MDRFQIVFPVVGDIDAEYEFETHAARSSIDPRALEVIKTPKTPDQLISALNAIAPVDLSFLLDSDGGYEESLNRFRRFMALAKNLGGVTRAFVPHKAGSAAAHLALEVDELFTTPRARFTFHSHAKVVRSTVPSLVGRGMVEVERHEATPEFTEKYHQWLKDNFPFTDPTPAPLRPIRAHIERALAKPDNPRGEFSLNGEDMQRLGKVKELLAKPKALEGRFVKLLPGRNPGAASTRFWK